MFLCGVAQQSMEKDAGAIDRMLAKGYSYIPKLGKMPHAQNWLNLDKNKTDLTTLQDTMAQLESYLSKDLSTKEMRNRLNSSITEAFDAANVPAGKGRDALVSHITAFSPNTKYADPLKILGNLHRNLVTNTKNTKINTPNLKDDIKKRLRQSSKLLVDDLRGYSNSQTLKPSVAQNLKNVSDLVSSGKATRNTVLGTGTAATLLPGYGGYKYLAGSPTPAINLTPKPTPTTSTNTTPKPDEFPAWIYPALGIGLPTAVAGTYLATQPRKKEQQQLVVQ